MNANHMTNRFNTLETAPKAQVSKNAKPETFDRIIPGSGQDQNYDNQHPANSLA